MRSLVSRNLDYIGESNIDRGISHSAYSILTVDKILWKLIFWEKISDIVPRKGILILEIWHNFSASG